MTRYIVAYDVSDDQERARIAAALSRCGTRLQRSVFEINIDADDRNALEVTLASRVNAKRDRVHMIPQCATCRARWRTWGQALTDLDALYWLV